MSSPDGRVAPSIIAVVCTRNRGDRIVRTIESILANDHPNFELVVVDQSEEDVTEQAVRKFGDDPRLTYVRSAETGLGRARNVGLAHARADHVAFTDDDVVVPPRWLATASEILEDRPRVAVGFFNVGAAPHDSSAGFVPTYLRHGKSEVRTLWGKCRAGGIGAGMFVRKSAILGLGGFDPMLGAGSVFPSCEDGDIAVRALLAKWHVYETDELEVIHDGFRTWAEGRALTERDWYGIGGAYSKPIKVGRWAMLPVLLYEGVWRAVFLPLTGLFRWQRPVGLKRSLHFWRGFVHGIRRPVARTSIMFEQNR